MKCKSKRTAVLLSAQNICANCGHEIEKDRDSYKGYRHTKQKPKYIGAPSTCAEIIGKFRNSCGCVNPEPEIEVKKE